MKYLTSIFAVLAVMFVVPPQASATPEWSDTAVAQAETYLRGLDTAQARFQQTAPDGSRITGTFYLDRPGKLRFNYDDPIEDFVVADGRFIYFYDAELGEQTNAPIGQTLADFLLRSDLRLSGDVRVTDVGHQGDYLTMRLVQAQDPEAGALILAFEQNPMRLKKWRVLDATGAITEVELFDLQTGVELADSLFIYFNPQKADPYNRNE